MMSNGLHVRGHLGGELGNKHLRGERERAFTRLWLGADRDHLCLWFERSDNIETIEHQTVVAQRNDHRLVTDFLVSQSLSWPEIDEFVLLQVPHSKTTIRVNAAFLATAAWYKNHSMQVVSVDSLDTVKIASLREQLNSGTSFDPQTVAEVV